MRIDLEKAPRTKVAYDAAKQFMTEEGWYDVLDVLEFVWNNSDIQFSSILSLFKSLEQDGIMEYRDRARFIRFAPEKSRRVYSSRKQGTPTLSI